MGIEMAVGPFLCCYRRKHRKNTSLFLGTVMVLWFLDILGA